MRLTVDGGVPIQISVYDDKILFWNNGRLPDDWTVERLLAKHPSQPFNPDIANAFFRAGMIEAWGRGIEQMQADCQAQGAPWPVLRHETTGLWVEFENRAPEKTPEKILALLTVDSMLTISELARRIDRSDSAIERAIRRLRKAGRLERIGPDRGGHWQVIENDK